MSHRIEFELGGRTMIIESGHLAKQANGAVTVQYGDSMVITTVCSSPEPRLGFDFFPLTVEYREKAYAAGKIPGGFFKREGRPSEKETVSARIIDRPIRPLFPDDFRGETQVINFIISHDRLNDTDVMALVGTAASLAISDVPFKKTIAGARVGRIDGQLVINPLMDQMDESDLLIIMAASADAILMVEGGGREILEADLVEALSFGHDQIKIIIAKIEELKALCGKEKFEYIPVVIDETVKAKVTEMVGSKLDEFNHLADKEERRTAKKAMQTEIIEALAEEFEDSEGDIKSVIHDLDSVSLRSMILTENIRMDGRGLDDVREITSQVSFLPRAHGSAVFTRGQTQALVAVTLGTKFDEQRLDELDGESTKSYMLHYNFPPFSVGEARPIRGTSRREVGHGVLAERALFPVIPTDDGFPYTLRIVSDILESNGSSSMASVCGGSLALMDAGVPIKCPIAGIAMGLISEGDKIAVLTDILGDEDHFGDMDFKVTGSAEGITAIQMDIKIDGLKLEILTDALGKARTARLHILDKMNETLSSHRENLSEYAPRIITIHIKPEKIGEVIGPGGKMIRRIVEETGAKIDIDDDGRVLISSVDSEAVAKAKAIVEGIVEEPEIGRVYNGKVVRVTDHGAVVEFGPNMDGWLHISELEYHRVDRVEDVLRMGDTTDIKVMSLEPGGKVRLSRKACMERPKGDSGGGDRGDRGGDRRPERSRNRR